MLIHFRSPLEEVLQRQNEILELIGRNAPTSYVLHKIIELIERQYPESICSILLLNSSKNTLYDGMSPHLPNEYVEAINGMKIGPESGSCGTAAFLKKTVIVSNIEVDPLWNNYRSLALKFGLKACWSRPIITPSGDIVGTFATYYRTIRIPTKEEQRLLDLYSYMAGIALEFRENKRKIIQLERYNRITNLPNHEEFIRQFDHLKELNPNKKSVIMMVNLNRFRMINTARGIEAGDFILEETARRLTSCLTKDEKLFHYHSDQFIILSNAYTKEQSNQLAEKILSVFVEPFDWKNQQSAITACIGISQYPNDSSNAEELIKYAELAANKAKTEGKNTFKFFNPLDRNKLIHLVEMDIELRKSLDFKHFSLHYQPYVSMDDNNIIGYEALIRWNHPILGSISPAEFIPLAEKIGLIIPIGEWVLKTACMQHKKWQQKFSANRNVSVNLSPKQFDDPKLVEKIACILNQTGMDGRYLTLELTETTIIKNFRQASQKLSQLMELGIQIAIDDFGMDHSSLNYLKELPINKLKIDRSFVRDILTDAKAKEILRTIVDLGHRLHFRVLAEGVEIKEQYDLLNSYDCDECQGYYISKPLSNIECEQFLSQVDKSMEWRFAK